MIKENKKKTLSGKLKYFDPQNLTVAESEFVP